MKKLFVGNLPYRSSETELRDWFTESGFTVDTVNVIRDRTTGDSRGFGFVEITSDDEADRAISVCNGRSFQGRTLVVSEARPNPARERFSGRGARSGTAAVGRDTYRTW